MKRCATGVAAVLAAAGAALGQFSDDFDRPDGPIGGDWGPQFGAFSNFIVENNRGGHSAGGAEGIIHNTASVDPLTVEHVIDAHANGTTLQYVALMIGLGGTQNLFIKVQQQTPDGFGFVGLYTGNNGGSWAGAEPSFFDLGGRFTAARIKVYFTNAGDTMNLEFDTDFNGTPEFSFTRPGVLSVGMGQRHGIGAFGPARFDNWRVGPETAPCYPDCDTSTGVGVLDIFDFLCFQNRYDAGAAYACDCDQSTGPGVCDIFDFLCFQNAYDAGCP